MRPRSLQVSGIGRTWLINAQQPGLSQSQFGFRESIGQKRCSVSVTSFGMVWYGRIECAVHVRGQVNSSRYSSCAVCTGGHSCQWGGRGEEGEGGGEGVRGPQHNGPVTAASHGARCGLTDRNLPCACSADRERNCARSIIITSKTRLVQATAASHLGKEKQQKREFASKPTPRCMVFEFRT